MNQFTRAWNTTPQARELHALLKKHGFFLITFPAESALFQCGGGAPVPSRVLMRTLPLAGLLNWAELETLTTRVPIADVVDYWAVTQAYQVGFAEPVRAEVYRYGKREQATPRWDLTVPEMLDSDMAARKLGRYSMLKRLSQHSRKLS